MTGVQTCALPICCVAAGFIGSSNDVHCRCQAGRFGCATHQGDDRFECIEQHAAAHPTQVRKETTLEGITPLTKTPANNIMSDANLNADAIGDLLQVVFENVLSKRITAAAITHQ